MSLANMITETAKSKYPRIAENYQAEFLVPVQARVHRRKRIHKKWFKRYGIKSVPISEAYKYENKNTKHFYIRQWR